MSQRKVVFFDRDGTLIYDILYLNDPSKIKYLPDVFSALKDLRDAGFEFVIVTNQSGMSKGIVSTVNINDIHNKMQADFNRHGLQILDFYYAHYMPETDHPLRKPNPGMLNEAQIKLNICMEKSWMVGDRITDVEAGHRAGCKTIMLSGNDEETPNHPIFAPPEAYLHSLIEVKNFIISN